MSFFDDFITKAKDTVMTIGNKASKVVDISKLKLNQADLNTELKKSFECMGKTVYKCMKEKKDCVEDITAKAADIDKIYSKLDEIKEEILKAKQDIKSKKDNEDTCSNAEYECNFTKEDESSKSEMPEEPVGEEDPIEYSSQDIELEKRGDPQA